MSVWMPAFAGMTEVDRGKVEYIHNSHIIPKCVMPAEAGIQSSYGDNETMCLSHSILSGPRPSPG
jgi:hypothetical protein